MILFPGLVDQAVEYKEDPRGRKEVYELTHFSFCSVASMPLEKTITDNYRPLSNSDYICAVSVEKPLGRYDIPFFCACQGTKHIEGI